MRIYHFTDDKDAKSIFKEGIRQGAVLNPSTGKIANGYLWLTLDGDPAHQSWATRHLISYSRTVWRFTVEIPEECEKNIMDRDAVVKAFPGTEPLYDGWDGSDMWRVYKGIIPVAWIRSVERMEEHR